MLNQQNYKGNKVYTSVTIWHEGKDLKAGLKPDPGLSLKAFLRRLFVFVDLKSCLTVLTETGHNDEL